MGEISMDFKTASQLGSIISKDYAEDFFKLLVVYQDISASEAAYFLLTATAILFSSVFLIFPWNMY